MDNKDLISQYVDTGLTIPEYQLMQLSNNDRKSYLRKRFIAIQQSEEFLEDYEFKLLDDYNKSAYANLGLKLPENQFMKLSDSDKKALVQKRILHPEKLYNDNDLEGYEFLVIDDKLNFLINVIKVNGVIQDYWLNWVSQSIKNDLMIYDIKTGVKGNIGELFNQVPLELKREFINAQIDANRQISNGLVYFMDDKLLNKFIDNEIKIKYKYGKWFSMVSSVFNMLPDNLKIKIINVCLDTGKMPSAFEKDYERLKNGQ